MKKSFRIISVILFIACCVLFISPIQSLSQSNTTYSSVYFQQARSAQTNIIYYYKMYDLTNYTNPETGQASTILCMSDYTMLKVLQGIVNRDAPRLFVEQNLVYYVDMDKDWKEYYESRGYKMVVLNSLSDVINTFKSYFKGTVTYNKTFTSDTWHRPEGDMACVVGYLTDRLPIFSSRQTEFQNNYGLYAASTLTLYDTFQDYYDSPIQINGHLETYGWTTPLEAYQWGYNNLLKFCNPHEFHSMCEESYDLCADRKMFYAYLRSIDANEFDLLKQIYSYYDARNDSFPVWGWVAQEDIDLHAMAAYGGILQCCASTNVSFHDKLPNTSKIFKHNVNYTTANTTVDTSKYYITFIAAENDAIRTATSQQHGAWYDSSRGNFPINWGFESWLVDQIPGVAEFYYSQATNNDYFFSGGASPLGFADYDDLPAAAQNEVKQLGAYYMQKTGQKYLDLYSAYGAVGAYDSTEYGDLAAKVGIDGMTVDEDGFSGQYANWNNSIVFPRECYPWRSDYMETLRGYPDVVQDFTDSFATYSNWTSEGGSWSVSNGEYIQTGTTQTISKANAFPTMTYLNYKASVKQTSLTTGKVGIAFRAGTGSNYYWFYLRDGSKAGLRKVVNGTETVLGTEVDFTYSADKWHTLKIVANGNNIKGYVSSPKMYESTEYYVESLVFDINDPQFSSGKIGLSCNSNSRFKDVRLVVTPQEEQIVNYIKARTVNVSRAKPYFMNGLYTDIFTDDNSKVQWGSEPGQNTTISVGPTTLKKVVDYFNTNYPGQFKFVRYDEWVSAARNYFNIPYSSDRVPPVATAIEGISSGISLDVINSANLRVRITENTNINTSAATLKWNVTGKSGTGSTALTGSASSGVDIVFNASNVNLDYGITGGVDSGDTVNFWAEGIDVAGNAFFTVNNSSGDPLASVKVKKNQVDAEKWNNWTITQGSTVSKVSNDKKNGTYSLKSIFQNASWQFVQKAGNWDATGMNGIGLWVKGTIGQAYIKCSDSDGTSCESSVSITPNQWSYVYVPFTSSVYGGDGIFNTSSITAVNLMYDPVLGGTGATYYYDDIEFVKDGTIIVDNDLYKDWFITTGSLGGMTVPAEGMGGGYALKSVYGGTTGDWQFSTIHGKWNATKCTGLGMWIKTSLSNAYIKLVDGDGTSCEGSVTTTPNAWTYVYLPFTASANGGDGVFNQESIVSINLMWYKPWGNGSSYYAYYYDNIGFIKQQTSAIDSETFENWVGSYYNNERTSSEKKNGSYALKAAFHNEGDQWQSIRLGGRWDASAYTKIGFWIKAPIANGYVKVYDSDGTKFEGNVSPSPTANTWTYVTVPFTSNVGGGNGTFNKDKIASVELMYYNGWGSGSNDYIYYFDDLSFTN